MPVYIQEISDAGAGRKRLVPERYLCILCETELRHMRADGSLEDECAGCHAIIQREMDQENLVETVCADVSLLTDAPGHPGTTGDDLRVEAVARLLGLAVSEDLSDAERKEVVTKVAERCGLIGG